MAAWIGEHRLLVLRGFAAFPGDPLWTSAGPLGELQDFEFGKVNESVTAGAAISHQIYAVRRSEARRSTRGITVAGSGMAAISSRRAAAASR
jgi:hypothetical protein